MAARAAAAQIPSGEADMKAHRRSPFTLFALLALLGASGAAAITIDFFPAGISAPSRIAVGHDGRVWVTSLLDCALTGYDASGGQYLHWGLPAGHCPAFIVAGPDANIWFTVPSQNEIWRAKADDTRDHVLYHPPTAASVPTDLAFGPDGNVWFT